MKDVFLAHLPRINDPEVTPPAFRRFCAFLVDIFILACLNLFLRIQVAIHWEPTYFLNDGPLFGDYKAIKILVLLQLIVGFLYFVVLQPIMKGSPGKKMMRLSLVTTEHNRLSFFVAVERYIVYNLCMIPLGLGFLPILFSKSGKGIHDSFTDTIVVRSCHRQVQNSSQSKNILKSLLPLTFFFLASLNTYSDMTHLKCDSSNYPECHRKIREGYSKVQGKFLQVTQLSNLACEAGDAFACALSKVSERFKFLSSEEFVYVEGAFGMKGYETLLKECSQGDSYSCSGAGLALRYGVWIEGNSKQASQFFEKSCNLGLLEGCVDLAELYQRGEGVQKLFEKAFSLHSTACASGVQPGCNGMGVMHWFGQGVERSVETALIIFSKSCEQGYGKACRNFGRLYWRGLGVPQNNKTAVKFFQKACALGDGGGCSLLGRDILETGGNQSNIKAHDLLLQACQMGDPYGCTLLGGTYVKSGKGDTQFVEAVNIFTKTCALREWEGCNSLGMMYYEGKGVAKSMSQAGFFVSMACEINPSKEGCLSKQKMLERYSIESLAALGVRETLIAINPIFGILQLLLAKFFGKIESRYEKFLAQKIY